MTTLSSQAAFGNYSPASIGWGGKYDPENHPSQLTKFVHSGVSFGSMHRLAVPIFTDLLNKLVPLIPGGLVKNTCGCYNPGSVTVGGDRSFHTYALAIDVNWNANPMYRHGRPTGPHTLPAKTSSIARSMGCEWGGDWSYPEDWMHIEIHLSPAECIAYANTRKPATPAPTTPTAPKEFTVDAEAKKRFDDLEGLIRHQTQMVDGVGNYNRQLLAKVGELQADVDALKAKPKPGA